MTLAMRILGGLTSLYMILLIIRIMLTWFSGARYGRPVDMLCRITDPYLDWFRRSLSLRIGSLDLSPIAAMAVLSVVNSVFITLGRQGVITLGQVLALLLSTLWSAVSFILGFFIIVLILRLIAYLANRNVYGFFWGIIDQLSRPVLFRINRIIFRNRLVNYLSGLMVSIAALLVLWIGLNAAVRLGVRFLFQVTISR